jgi:hypothetical protein
MKKPILVLFASALAVSLGAPAANACGDEWVPILRVDPRIHGVAEAESTLSKGGALAAAGTVIRMMPHVGQLDGKKSALVARAQRVLAVALARNDGVLSLEREVPSYARGRWSGKATGERAQNLEWAIGVLRGQLERKKDDPALETDLAEVLARVDSKRGEARAILERLAQKDLVATPSGYAVLASLRAASGDLEGREVALARCRKMSDRGLACGAAAHG